MSTYQVQYNDAGEWRSFCGDLSSKRVAKRHALSVAKFRPRTVVRVVKIEQVIERVFVPASSSDNTASEQ